MRFNSGLVTLIPIVLIGCEPPQTCSTCADEAGDTIGSESGTDETSSTDETSTDETEGDACELAQDDPMADTAMTFQLVNLGATAIFVAATDDCVSNDFRLRFDGVDALWTSTLANQGNQCASMQPPCGFVCTNDDPEQYLRIEPGESADLHWDGYWWETVTVDSACLSPECTGDVMCNAGRQAGGGSMFSLEATALSECTPSDFECDCQPGETSCLIYSYGGVGGASETAMQDFAFAGDSTVVIEFGG